MSWTRRMSATGAVPTAMRCPGRRSPTRGRPSSAAPWPTGSARRPFPGHLVGRELAVAQAVGFPARRVLLHGNAKTPDDLRAATGYRVGRIVLDSAGEIGLLAAITPDKQRVLLRVAPGVDAGTHASVAAGGEDQKFGFALSSGRPPTPWPGCCGSRNWSSPACIATWVADHPAADVRAGRPAAHRADGGGSCRARPGPARANLGGGTPSRTPTATPSSTCKDSPTGSAG